MSINQSILEKIARLKSGTIFFPVDFRGSGTDTAIKMSLSRIEKTGIIKRISHGIYYKPKSGQKNSASMPGAEELAEAIAAKEKIRIKPSGLLAQYKLNFIDQAPNDLTYMTDGEPRKLLVGSQYVVFTPTTPKKLSMKGHISSLVIQFMDDMGKNGITPDYVAKIKSALLKEDPKILSDDVKKAAAWIYNYLINLKILEN